MALTAKYRLYREGKWRLLALSQSWSEGLWKEIDRQIEQQPMTNRIQVKPLRYPPGQNGEEFFLKIYRPKPLEMLKDLFRDSKAFRALKSGEALSKVGFHVPLTVAAGEERHLGFLKKAFLLTLKVETFPLRLFLQRNYSATPDPPALRKKREYLRCLASEIRRLHRYGFVHGDLVPSNILVRSGAERIDFFYLDNDRTRHYPTWLPHTLWKRNLVQLNRFVLPGISLQDRMRFLKVYLGERPWKEGDRRLMRWLEKKTRKRRQECDRIEAQVSFRELMRWNGPFGIYID